MSSVPSFAEEIPSPVAIMSIGEAISRRCNRDADTSGAFWEHRFDCRSLADEAAILVCGVYVDLNAIRACEADTPEQSRHTSAYDRIQGLQQRLIGNAEETFQANSPLPIVGSAS